MEILYIILAIIASEITFVLGLLVATFATRFLNVIYLFIRLQKKYVWMLGGIICGICATFFSCYVSYLILKKFNYSELIIILVAIILPIIGEFGYYRYLYKKIKTSNVGRLHYALKHIPEAAEMQANISYIINEGLSIYADADFNSKENSEIVRQTAHKRTEAYLFYLFVYSVIGDIVGLFLVHHFLF